MTTPRMLRVNPADGSVVAYKPNADPDYPWQVVYGDEWNAWPEHAVTEWIELVPDPSAHTECFHPFCWVCEAFASPPGEVDAQGSRLRDWVVKTRAQVEERRDGRNYNTGTDDYFGGYAAALSSVLTVVDHVPAAPVGERSRP